MRSPRGWGEGRGSSSSTSLTGARPPLVFVQIRSWRDHTRKRDNNAFVFPTIASRIAAKASTPTLSFWIVETLSE